MQLTQQYLLLQSPPQNPEAITHCLEKAGIRFTLKRIDQLDQLEQTLMGSSWDGVLCFADRGLDVNQALQVVREKTPQVPFLILSEATLDENKIKELLRHEHVETKADGESAQHEPTLDFKTVLDAVRDFAVIFLDDKGRVLSWNSGAKRLYGYSEDEMRGRSLDVVFAEDERKQNLLRRELGKAQAESRYEDERWHLRKNGSRFWGSGVTSPFLKNDGSLGGFIKILRDSTHKKQAMEQVEEARKRAENISKAKTQFLADMSQQIRTPLGIMLGYAELLMDPKHTAEEKLGFTQTILRNGQELSRIVNDVVDVSKVEANKLETTKMDFTLSEFLSDVLAMMRLQAEEKGLELVVTTEGPVPRRVFSDPSRIRQILGNLMGNAIKYTDTGVIELRVRSVSSPQTHSSMILEFEVKDTGQGMAADTVAKLFQPFPQGESADDRKRGGAGLGLYLSKRLAQALGGDLVLRETSENRGSTFVFTVDAGPFETDVTFYTERAALESSAHTEKSLYGLKILVVDDSPDNRLLVRRILEHAQAEVETADNGLAAVESGRNQEFDLVLMDIQMPVMDGYEAFKQLRQGGFTKPIVALTAHALHSEREYCFSLGFDDHLSKPIDRKILLETIQRLAQKEQASTRPHLIALHPENRAH